MRAPVLMMLCLCSLLTSKVSAATITAVANGAWTTNSTWSCNCQPSNADNVIIPAGTTVSITGGPVILFLGPVITITINGTLSLNTGASLIVDATDIIRVNTGGKITSTGPLNSIWSGVTSIPVAGGTTINGPSTITSGTLPITLLFFKGQAGPEGVVLEWASASEKNFDFFAIERSIDGINFETIEKVKGAGNSVHRLDYSYVDRDPLAGVSYYRLRSVDLDGRKEVFNIVRIYREVARESVTIYPNPITGNQLNIKLGSLPHGGGQITVYDAQGILIANSILDASTVDYTLDLPSSMGKGLYAVVIKAKNLNYKSTLLR